MALPVYRPMLATRSQTVADGEGWVHEVKWDGVRAIVSGDGSIRSRNGNRIESSYPELDGVVPADVVIDGEVVALDGAGRPSFQALASRMHVRHPSATLMEEVPVSFMAFDVLHAGESQVEQPWTVRRLLLESLELLPPVTLTDVSDDGKALFGAVRELDLEGIVSKRSSSRYRPGERSDDWRKTVHRKTCEAVVVAALAGSGSRTRTFGSLALALWTGEALRYIGSVGSGFDDATLRAVDAALTQMERPGPPPLEDPGLIPMPARWVEPVLVAVVEYSSWTRDGRLRAPVFKGFSATPVDEVTWDREGPG